MILVYFTEKKTDSDRFIYASYGAYCRIKGINKLNVSVERSAKPVFKTDGGANCGVHFSLSHSNNLTACAISDEEIGLDVQIHSDIDFTALSNRFFKREITDKKEFFDRFACGEARTKLNGGELLNGLLEGGGSIYNLFSEYSVAVCGGNGTVFFQEEYEQD